MKKLLLLGGSRFLIPVIDVIHRLGYYAITCDYLPDNIAHQYSDEYHNVSIIEKEEVLELAQKLKVDGVMSFACDPGVETAAYVAEKMGLPTQPYESVCILQDKAKFRKFLAENGFNVPKAKGYSDIAEANRDAGDYCWPIIVKPVDSAGSKGVTRVDRIEELDNAAHYAMTFSKTHRFIIEEFIEKKGCSSDSDCFSVDGKLVFASFSNQRFDEQAENPYTPAAYTWPSTMSEQAQNELRSEIQRLIKLLKLNTSIYNIETREGLDGKAYIMEVSPRGGGNRLAEMMKYASNTDLITAAVKASVGELPDSRWADPVYDGSWAEVILHAETNGKFKNLWISDEVRPFAKEIDLWIKPGDIVHRFTGANETVGTVVLKFDEQNQMEKYIAHIEDYIKVEVY